jgi:predicted flap endonuclease-1-like 5' DNA nuclease
VELPEVKLPQVEIEAGEVAPFEIADMALPAAAGVVLPMVEVVEEAVEPEPAVVEAPEVLAPEVETSPVEPEPSEADRLRAELEALRQQLAQLQSQAAPAPAAPAEALDESEAIDLEAQAARLPGTDEVARIAAEMAAIAPRRGGSVPLDAPAGGSLPRRGPTGEDNLELIMGVGPIYVKRLRELGITTFEQLADASYEDLDKVTRGNLERVVKEDWRGQARRLMQSE